MEPVEDFKQGIYRHYKGPLYQTLGVAHDANADVLADYLQTMERVYAHNRGDEGVPNKPTPLDERTVVVYIALQLDGAHLGPRLAVRTLDDFTATVCTTKVCLGYGAASSHRADACISCGWPTRPRFEYLGAQLHSWMLPEDAST